MTVPAHELQAMIREAIAAYTRGDRDDAERRCRTVLAHRPNDPNCHRLLGLIAKDVHLLDDAAEEYTLALRAAPSDPTLNCELATIRSLQGRFDEASALFNRVLESGEHPAAAAGLADLLEKQGRRDEAFGLIQYYTASGKDTPLMTQVHVTILCARHQCDDARRIADAALARPDMLPMYAQQIQLTLGRAYERARVIDAAFACYVAGNAAAAIPYDADAERHLIDSLIALYSADLLSALPVADTRSQHPVFIIGLPRSGTTLLERIMAAHPEVHGAGEVRTLPALLEPVFLPDDVRPETLRSTLTQSRINEISDSYLSQLQSMAPDAHRIVDKNLAAYKYAGLLPRLFPHCRIIHMSRDLLDTGFACFTARLPVAGNPYASRLEDIGPHIVAYS
ncbi:MAG: sulfotransferase, partial [Phycisphaerales bacterium]|nr:sulfotransferase [Phycisphaerales bacterium]